MRRGAQQKKISGCCSIATEWCPCLAALRLNAMNDKNSNPGSQTIRRWYWPIPSYYSGRIPNWNTATINAAKPHRPRLLRQFKVAASAHGFLPKWTVGSRKTITLRMWLRRCQSSSLRRRCCHAWPWSTGTPNERYPRSSARSRGLHPAGAR